MDSLRIHVDAGEPTPPRGQISENTTASAPEIENADIGSYPDAELDRGTLELFGDSRPDPDKILGIWAAVHAVPEPRWRER